MTIGYPHTKEWRCLPNSLDIKKKKILKGIRNLNIGAKTIKFIEENIRVNVHDFESSNDITFLDITEKKNATREKN